MVPHSFQKVQIPLGSSYGEFDAGIQTLKTGIDALQEGAGALSDGINSYTTGADQLNDGIQTYLGSIES